VSRNLDASTPRRLDTSMPRHLDASMPRHLDASMPRRLDDSTLGRRAWMKVLEGDDERKDESSH
jgi:hypothetical protein